VIRRARNLVIVNYVIIEMIFPNVGDRILCVNAVSLIGVTRQEVGDVNQQDPGRSRVN
jgi:hypothetical protein